MAEHGDRELKLVIIVTRHGICAPGSTETLGKYAAESWPRWEVPTGHLTRHGEQQMILMGKFYRERYVKEGVLTGETPQDIKHIYLRANSDQRTLESARRLGIGLLPEGQPQVQARPQNETDPLFRPYLVPVGHADKALADAAVLGRIGNNPTSVVLAHEAAYATVQRVLFGRSSKEPVGKESLFAQSTSIAPSLGPHIVAFSGPLRMGMVLADIFLMQYVEGRPFSEVGWGRVTRRTLTQTLELHSLYMDLTQRTFYPAQVQGSNLASHILKTFDQAVAGQPSSGAIGSPTDRIVVLVGHDTNLANLGGLLGMSWACDGLMNPTIPGGALVFELRQQVRNRQFFVRALYISQTLDQMRTSQSLTVANPPAIAPVFIPGCSDATAGYDAPLMKFAERLRQVIDPEFVVQ
jgi:4-phytase/acid phosphatase